MKGRDQAKGAAPPADLLVCFPSRSHLSLMTPKRVCSPARPSEPNKRQHNHHHRHHNHQLRKSGTRGGGAGQASPLLWSKNKQIGSEISEPTSPKVTCAGQIKVRPKSSACKSWQSVMEEIERIHSNRNRKKRSNWVESLGFKKEIMQFLTCLRSIRFDLSCFGNFPRAEITSDDDEEEEVDEVHHESNENVVGTDENSGTVFSKWYMVLQENQGNGFCREERKQRNSCFDESAESVEGASSVPPPNALLLMRCRSAPAKSWLEEKEEQEQGVDEETEDKENEKQEEEKEKVKEEKKSRNLRSLMEEEKINNKQNLAVMRYNTDFYKLSSDIAKETWVVGGMRDLLSRSRSWKR
ncbi:hypothetical protein HS088_TW12G00937 [Tripterygium wilfordii]|uniref:Uncharacterized protein n=1 Tax=Tripterygium wilfordii TaxID=458696 RepID=A0A7J7D054_TRIWF|nr:uncharacterized protein LOC120010772 [Tripterygium wilfordii]KAF5739727.1 hypothetical protein HS088_TW12G00937 [Tripterygium wilfordii]